MSFFGWQHTKFFKGSAEGLAKFRVLLYAESWRIAWRENQKNHPSEIAEAHLKM